MTSSVALCTYNGEKFIAEQLNSIASQTVSVDEIIICDDCSRDKTCEIIKLFISKHPELNAHLYRNENNIGFLRNFEKALSLCSGDIIFLSDQDDIWMKDKVEKFCRYFESHPEIEFAFSNAVLVNNIGIRSYTKTLFDVVGLDKHNKRMLDKGFSMELLATSGRVTGCASALRSSFLPYCIPFPNATIKPIHDEIIAVRAAGRRSLGYIDRCLLQYRQHGSQTVGISLLFKFPPSHWEVAPGIRTWNEELLDPTDSLAIQRQHFVRQRFVWMRSPFSLAKFCWALVNGQYQKNYENYFQAFLSDTAGVFSRAFVRTTRFLTGKRYLNRS